MSLRSACLLLGTVSCASGAFVSGSAAEPAAIPVWNNTKCPSFQELRAPHVVSQFNTDRDIPGFYYELALHDITQYPLCPSTPKCISSNKTLALHSDGQQYVDDAWNLYCT